MSNRTLKGDPVKRSIVAAEAITIHTFIGYDYKKADLNDPIIGAVDEAYDSGDTMRVFTDGEALMELGGTVAQGDALIPDADGHAIKRVPPSVFKKKLADQAISASATLTNDTHFVFPVNANSIWNIHMRIYAVNAKAAAQTINMAFAVPSGATIIGSVVDANSDGDTWTAIEQAADFTSAVGVVIDLSEVAYIDLNLTLTVGATAGNAQFQWCQAVSDAAAITVKVGSTLVAHHEGELPIAAYALDAGTDGHIIPVDLV